MFVIQLGVEVEDKVTGLKGIITARSENLNMCNRYYIQPSVNKDMKIPDGWWVDEMQIKIIGKGVAPKPEKERTKGGPMGRNY
jgi:hypothetical protein